MYKRQVYDDFLDRPLAYGVSISLPEGLLCIGGCDRTQCSDNVFLIKKEEDSFVIDSVSYPSVSYTHLFLPSFPVYPRFHLWKHR